MRDKWNRASTAIELDPDQLSQLIAPAFPGRVVEDWQHAEGGLANTNIRLRISNRSQPLSLRIFVRDPAQALKEWNLNWLVHQAIPVPEFHYFGASNPFSGHPYILMDWIDGVRLEEVILNLPIADVETLGRSVGCALAGIHSFKFEFAGFFDSQLSVNTRIELGGAGLIEYAQRCLVDGIAGERFGSETTERILGFLNAKAPLLDEWPGQPCLAHSDFGGSNILVRKGADGWRVAAILDWEFAFSGSPFFDFGNLLRAPHGTIPGFEDALIDGYQSSGSNLPQQWRAMSLLTDLTAWFEFLTRPNPGANLVSDARRVVLETIDQLSITDKTALR